MQEVRLKKSIIQMGCFFPSLIFFAQNRDGWLTTFCFEQTMLLIIAELKVLNS